MMAFERKLAFQASAGSGKTFALVIRYISLLYLDAKPSTILALTFTNKAANEMSERINSVLRELHLPNRNAERNALCEATGKSPHEIMEERAKIYQTFLQSDLKISTIDKFFAQILRKFSLNLSLMPDFKIEEIADELAFIETFIKHAKAENYYKNLIYFAAAENRKLGNIFTFLEDLYAKEADLEQIALKAPQPQNEKELLKIARKIQMLFFDCPTLSQRAKNTLTFETVDELLEKEWIKKETLAYWDFKKCFMPAADTLLHELKNALKIYFTNKEAYLQKQFFELYALYKKTKISQNIARNELSFNDVTHAVYKLLCQNIESDFLYFRLDAKIDHVLIDEFQDTNITQYKILKPILDEISAGFGVKSFKTLFYVGDVKQSIYRFRGGAKALFSHVQKTYDVTLKSLITNYRSEANIVTFINETFKDKIEGYEPQKFLESDSKGFVKVSRVSDLHEGIVEHLFFLLENGIHADDIAILTYANADAFEIEEALLQKDPTLKITTQTTAKLIHAPMVSAIIEFLKYLYFKENIYKANFLAAIGLSWDTPLEVKAFDIDKNLVVLVKQIIDHFGLYAHDASLLKFLEVLGDYGDIEAFLYVCETLNIDSPAKKSEGIKILTIHKSKGLEFEHVIVCDRFKKKNNDTSTFIFDYEGIELRNLYTRLSSREAFDPDYKNAQEAQKKLVGEDELNLLYVAFTRAKSSLIICQKEKDSSFEALGLEPSSKGSPTTKAQKTPTIQESPLNYQRSILGLQEKKLKPQKQESNDFEAIQFGLALHHMLESLETFEHKSLENAFWAMQNRYATLLDPHALEEIKQRVSILLSHEPFIALTKGVIYKEQPIAYQGELKQLDMLVEFHDRWVIVDYKSAQHASSSHHKQVAYYKQAISKIMIDKPVDAYLCYLGSSSVELLPIS